MRNTLMLSVVLVASLLGGGCVIREQPAAYPSYPASYAQNAVYYGDGYYWAQRDASWYWWANDHWALYGPYRPAVVLAPYHHRRDLGYSYRGHRALGSDGLRGHQRSTHGGSPHGGGHSRRH